jgi:hypothetical protein
MWSLLDSDQPQPWPDQPLVYYQKYRFYYQEYTEGFHVVSVPRQGWGIAAAGGNAEYVESDSSHFCGFLRESMSHFHQFLIKHTTSTNLIFPI